MSARELIGTREGFGVEIEPHHVHESHLGVYGGVRFWVGGRAFGDLADPTFLKLVARVRSVFASSATHGEPDFARLDDDAVWRSQDEKSDRDHVFYDGEGFDRFRVYAWREAGWVRFCWRERPWDGGYREPTYGGRAPIEECVRVVAEFEERVRVLSTGATSWCSRPPVE